jgi:hypothetical protein
MNILQLLGIIAPVLVRPAPQIMPSKCPVFLYCAALPSLVGASAENLLSCLRCAAGLPRVWDNG